MARRTQFSAWARTFQRSIKAVGIRQLRVGKAVAVKALKRKPAARGPAAGAGEWIGGVASGLAGARRFRFYRPPGVKPRERLPLVVMLHGCGQDAESFAALTRMNRVALRERFLVLYPEQARVANAQGCWNWFDTSSGRAYGEADVIMNAIEQVCLAHPVDRSRIAVAGLSAGASMAALLVTRHPDRFKALVMHSGVAPGRAHSTWSAIGAMRGHGNTKPLEATPTTMAASWPSLMVIQGAADHVVAADNGQGAAQVWADAAGAVAGKGRSVQRGRRRAMTVTDFKHGRRTMATLVEVAGLGHAWSGGAAKQPFSDELGPDASRMVWAFAARQFRA